MPPIAVRETYRPVNVPPVYQAGWLRDQLGKIARSLWVPASRSVIAATTVTAADECLFVNCTAGAITVTFPLASQMQFARITVKKVDVTANAITLAATIDGTVNPTITTAMARLTVQSDGTSWWLV